MPFHKDPWGYSLGKGVRPLSVIEPLDVIKDICPGVGASLIPPPMHPFPFEYGKNALRHGMVITVPHATHAADNPMRVEKRLTLLRRVLGAPVGRMTACGLRFCHTAISTAWRTRSRVSCGCIDHPITWRENKSRTTAK